MTTRKQWPSRFWGCFFCCLGFESFVNSAAFVSFPEDTLSGFGVLFTLIVPILIIIVFATVGSAKEPSMPVASEAAPWRGRLKAMLWGIARFLVLFGLYVFFTWLSLTIPDAEPRKPELGPKMDPNSREQWAIFCLLSAPVCAIVAGYWPLVFGKGNSPKDSAYVLPPPIIEQ